MIKDTIILHLTTQKHNRNRHFDMSRLNLCTVNRFSVRDTVNYIISGSEIPNRPTEIKNSGLTKSPGSIVAREIEVLTRDSFA